VPIGLPSLKALRAFSSVAADGSFERAAQRLGVSRSAVSHLVSDLEDQLGVRVLVRSRRGVSITHDGKALLLSMGDALQRIETAIESFRRDRNQIRLSTLATFASCWLLPRLPDLQAQHPHLQLSLSTAIQAVDFSIEDFDCAVRHGVGPWPDLDCTLLFREALVLVGLPQLIRRIGDRDLRLSLSHTRIIQARSRPEDLRQWWQGVGLTGSLPRSSLVVENREQALAAAIAGAGLTLINPQYVEPPSPMSVLAKLPSKIVSLSAGFFFVTPQRNRGRKNISLLSAWLTSEACKLSDRAIRGPR